MNTSSFNTQAYVLLTPTLKIVDGEQVCTVSFSYQDDPLGDEERWVHTMLRCHKATATYACNNLKKGDLIFITGARYHVDEVEDIRGEVKRTHYFSRGSISKLMSADDMATIKTLKHADAVAAKSFGVETDDNGKTGMSAEEWESFIAKEPAPENAVEQYIQDEDSTPAIEEFKNEGLPF